jgi:hypothetical protein
LFLFDYVKFGYIESSKEGIKRIWINQKQGFHRSQTN